MTPVAASLDQQTATDDLLWLAAAPQRETDDHALNVALRIIAEQQRRIRQLENEAHTDPMTGLLNKRGFAAAMNRELDRTERQNETKALLVMFDLDGLKQINDRYGHLAGDAYISGFAKALKRRVRTTDYVARLGGDEFALLMTDVTPEIAIKRIATIVDCLNRDVVNHGSLRFTLAVSHGTAPILPGSDYLMLVDEADGNLYRCKASRKQIA